MDVPAGPFCLADFQKLLSTYPRGYRDLGIKINSDDVVALKESSDEDTPFVGWLGSRADEGRG